jgi:DNA-binding MarR family transcriptional regulator
VRPFHSLLQQVRRKQLLLCAYQPEHDGGMQPLSFADLTATLQLSSPDCLALVSRLVAKGLLLPVPGNDDDRLELTERGQRLVKRMGARADRALA